MIFFISVFSLRLFSIANYSVDSFDYEGTGEMKTNNVACCLRLMNKYELNDVISYRITQSKENILAFK